MALPSETTKGFQSVYKSESEKTIVMYIYLCVYLSSVCHLKTHIDHIEILGSSSEKGMEHHPLTRPASAVNGTAGHVAIFGDDLATVVA